MRLNGEKSSPQQKRIIRRRFDSLISVPVFATIRVGTAFDRRQYIEGYELIEEEILKGRKGFIFKVKDDSMDGDHIYEGDRVVVVQDDVNTTDIAVVAVSNGKATLKRVKVEGAWVCLFLPIQK